MYSESQQKKQQLPPIEEEKSKEAIELIDTNFEKEEAPPPLPEKDYNNDKGIDSLASKLEALAASNNQNDDSDSNEDDDDDKQLEPPRQYNRTVSDEYNQNTSNVNYNNSESIIEEETTAASNDLAEDEDDDSDESVNARKVYAKARMFNYSSNHLIITSVIWFAYRKIHINIFYLKDSSDEDDYDYASREVNFDDSESENDVEDESDNKELSSKNLEKKS